MDVLITVVIPIYNQEKYLRECLMSLFVQCTPEIEVIMVDDGSTDKSRDICVDLIDKYSVNARLITQENSGSLRSRVNGVSNASGEYIFFMDSDDLLLEKALETLLEVIHQKRYDMILFNATCNLETRKPLFNIPLRHKQEFLDEEDKYQVYRLLCGTNVLNNLWTKCFRKELYQSASMPEAGQRLTNGEDLYQILDLVDAARSIIYIDRVLYYYRVMNDSISRVYNPYYFSSEKTVCSKRFGYASKWGKGDELIPGVRVETYKIMREIARKVFVSKMPWKDAKKEIQKLRSDSFFRQYYMDAHDAPDRRDIVLKAPLLVLHLARILMGKGKAK